MRLTHLLLGIGSCVLLTLAYSHRATAATKCDASRFVGNWEITHALEGYAGKPWRNHYIGKVLVFEKGQTVLDHKNKWSKNTFGLSWDGQSYYVRTYALSSAKDSSKITAGWQRCQIYNPETGYKGIVLLEDSGSQMQMENWSDMRLSLRKVDLLPQSPTRELIPTWTESDGVQWGLPRGFISFVAGSSIETNQDFTKSLAKMCEDRGARLPNISDLERVMSSLGAKSLKGKQISDEGVKAVAESPNVVALFETGPEVERNFSKQLFLGKFAHNQIYYYSAFGLSEEGVVAKTLRFYKSVKTAVSNRIEETQLIVVYRMTAKDGPKSDSPVLPDNDASFYSRSSVAEDVLQPCIFAN